MKAAPFGGGGECNRELTLLGVFQSSSDPEQVHGLQHPTPVTYMMMAELPVIKPDITELNRIAIARPNVSVHVRMGWVVLKSVVHQRRLGHYRCAEGLLDHGAVTLQGFVPVQHLLVGELLKRLDVIERCDVDAAQVQLVRAKRHVPEFGLE